MFYGRVAQLRVISTGADNSGRQRSLNGVLLAAVLYLAIGITSAALGRLAASNDRRFFWRLSAFGISAVVFVTHVAYEQFRLRNAVWPTAWHASKAVALAAFALALGAVSRGLESASGLQSKMLVALVAWPLLTGVPAFIVAAAGAALLARARLRGSP